MLGSKQTHNHPEYFMLFYALISLAVAGGPKTNVSVSVTVEDSICFTATTQDPPGKPMLTNWIKPTGGDPLVGLVSPNVWWIDIPPYCQFVVSSIPIGRSWVPGNRVWSIHYDSGPIVIEEGRDYRIVVSETTIKERICLSEQF